MNEDFNIFSQNLNQTIENKIEPFSEHYEIEKEFLQNINYIMEEEFQSDSIELILEMEKSIQIDIDISTKDSSDNETVSEVIKILNEPIKKKFLCKICQKSYCSCIKKPKPIINYGKNVFKGCKKSVYIARRVQIKTNL
jgi:hypothetical protein